MMNAMSALHASLHLPDPRLRPCLCRLPGRRVMAMRQPWARDRAARLSARRAAGAAGGRDFLGHGQADRRDRRRISAHAVGPAGSDRDRLHARASPRSGASSRISTWCRTSTPSTSPCSGSAALGLGSACNRFARGAAVRKNRLKVLRAERDWSQGDLAERLASLPPERQRDRDRPLRSEPAARLPHRRAVRAARSRRSSPRTERQETKS